MDHHRVLKSPPSVPVLKQINPADNLPIDLFKIYFNIVFHLRLALPKSAVYQVSLELYYIKNQQDASLAVLFISHCKIALHVSDAFCVHHQEY